MKKRIVSVFMVVSMSFTLFYPEISLNDNVLIIEEDADFEEIEGKLSKEFWESVSIEDVSMLDLMRAKKGEKKFKLKFLEWISGFSK